MTNLEKFEQTYGMKVDDMPDDICGIITHEICIEHNCNNKCPAYDFWNREYKNQKEEHDGD